MNVLNRFQLNWFLNMLCQVEASSSGVGDMAQRVERGFEAPALFSW